MAKPEWGTKRICQNCGAKFYDLQRSPATCPVCGTAYDPSLEAKPRRVRVAAPVPREAEAVVAREEAFGEPAAALDVEEADEAMAEPEDEGVEDVEVAEEASEFDEDEDVGDIEEEDLTALEDEEEAEEPLEDPSELGEGEEDMTDVIEGVEDDEEHT